MTTARQDLPFPDGLHRSAYDDRDEWMASARFTTDLLARTIGRDRLEGVDLLEVGCGIKVTKALLDDGWPVRRYVGIDVEPEVIAWLREHVADPRFTFERLDARNDLYNPGGTPLGAIDRLPAGDEPFDLIGLFSVFTHLAPDDFSAMLRLLRPHLKPDGRLVFSLFLTDPHGAWAAVLEQALASDDPAVAEKALAAIGGAMQQPGERFVDEVPDVPLMRARYDRSYALELVAESGAWAVEAVHPPTPYIQNHIVCRPI